MQDQIIKYEAEIKQLNSEIATLNKTIKNKDDEEKDFRDTLLKGGEEKDHIIAKLDEELD